MKTHLDLFSGLGGFALAAQWAGFQTLQFVEINKFCQAVLQKHWPNVPIHNDIKTFDASNYTGRIDLITGGVPCQPASQAGARRGTEDDRWLWPETFKIIRIVRPTWVLLENVRGLLTLDNGMVFEKLLSELENCGYEVQPIIIPACAINAPHRRDRIWFIAHAIGHDVGGAPRTIQETERLQKRDDMAESCKSGEAPDATNTERKGHERQEHKEGQNARHNRRTQFISWNENWPTVATKLCIMDDGISNRLVRLPNGTKISKLRWRNEGIKAAGNAIVPQVAYQILRNFTFP